MKTARHPFAAYLLIAAIAVSPDARAQSDSPLPQYEIIPLGSNYDDASIVFTAYKVDRQHNKIEFCGVAAVTSKHAFNSARHLDGATCSVMYGGEAYGRLATSVVRAATFKAESHRSVLSQPSGLWAIDPASGDLSFCSEAAGEGPKCVKVVDQ